MKFKTIEEAAAFWKITGLSQLSDNWWVGEDREDRNAVIRFDKEAGWAELFRISEWRGIQP